MSGLSNPIFAWTSGQRKAAPINWDYSRILLIEILEKMIRAFIFLCLVGVLPWSNALGEEKYCTDLFAPSCEAEASKTKNSYTNARDSAVNAEIPALKQEFMADLSASKSSLKEIVQKSLDPKELQDCSKDSNSKSCQEKIAEQLANLAAQDISLEGLPEFKTHFHLKTILALRENSAYKKIIESTRSNIIKKFVPAGKEDHIRNDLFPDVKKFLTDKIQSLDIADDVKQVMINKLKAIQFAGTDCGLIKGEFKNVLDQKLIPQAFYGPEVDKFRICKGLLSSGQGDLGILFLIGHELTHSIDPCELDESDFERLKKEMPSKYPIKNLIQCLRSPESIAAKKVDRSMEWTDLIFAREARPDCRMDQIGESMADWFGGEVIGEYLQKASPPLSPAETLKGMTELTQNFCPLPGEKITARGSHPKVDDRINKLLLANPDIRKSLGCASSTGAAGYCDGRSAQATRAVQGIPSSSSSNQSSGGKR